MGKFVQDTVHQLISEWSTCCRRYDNNILADFLGHRIVVVVVAAVVVSAAATTTATVTTSR